MGVAGLLLTGGASARMGVAKAELRLDGRRLADRAAGVLAAVCGPVLEVGPGAAPALASVVEPEPGSGPLVALAAGVAALRAAGHAGSLVLLAVDLPFVDVGLLELVARHGPPGATVVPVAGGVAQPLCARYGPAALDDAAGLVDAGRRSLRALLDATPYETLAEREWRAVAPVYALDDVDTPEEAVRMGLEWPG